MNSRFFTFARQVALLTAVSLSFAAPAYAKRAPRKLLESSQVVQDLYYGDVLFYFYQDDYFQALTRVDAALDLGRVDHHLVESRLLKGGLYLSIGQHVEAGNIFKELLNDNVPDHVRNRAWFYLAKVWYQRGYYDDADHALNSIAGTLEDGLESERRLLHAEVLMGQGRYADAITALSALPERDRFAPYARFNLGVALVRENRIDEARKALDSVGTMSGPTEELRSLRDKANLALGFAYLKDNRPDEASQMLQRVRLEGPQSTKALLGMGWADAAGQRFKNALAPWLELHKRNLLDAAVQESYLAVPYAYGQLAATRQAAEQYANAIDAFGAESARIDESIAAIRSGGLVNTLLNDDRNAGMGWYWQLQKLPDAPETRYTFHLLATHEFQEGLKNYRDLKAMQLNLARWSQAAVAFQDIVDTRRHAFAERMPRINDILSQIDLEGMEARKVDIGSRIAVIERDSDVVGLATAAELEQWNKVQAIEQALAGAATNDPATEEAQAKLRMIKGVLFWNMNSSYKARLWHAKKEQRELEVAVKEARRRWTLIERARVDGPARTEEFAARVAKLQPRVEALVARLDVAADTQNRYLAEVAIRELEIQKERLASYGLQAQFALAAIYDRATNASNAAAPTPPNPTVVPPTEAAAPGATP
jgi:lipopolysaccharide biosynthesis regulator YciM